MHGTARVPFRQSSSRLGAPVNASSGLQLCHSSSDCWPPPQPWLGLVWHGGASILKMDKLLKKLEKKVRCGPQLACCTWTVDTLASTSSL